MSYHSLTGVATAPIESNHVYEKTLRQ